MAMIPPLSSLTFVPRASVAYRFAGAVNASPLRLLLVRKTTPFLSRRWCRLPRGPLADERNMKAELGPIEVERKSGKEPFHRNGDPLPFDLLGFWQWSASDLLSNATRGILAEYLVAKDLGVTDGARVEWDVFDATTMEGVKVEVKAASYLQSWHQNTYSRISYSTRSTYAWGASTNRFSEEQKRQADVYVFCLLDHKDQRTVDPLNVNQWRFFVVSAERLNEEIGEQKSISLSRLEQIGAIEAQFGEISQAITKALQTS